MPHLLIAGTTNSGKSILIRSMAVCLVMNNTPETLRLVMIDPKRVELFRFNGLPHLLGKVETENDRSISVLGWAVQEMKNRYKLFETIGIRKLDAYNQYAKKNGQKPLPHIVIFIDELAEIMKGADKLGQDYIDTLASLARATGIHLVVATQRPDTTIITGKIKTNIPARIALNVASAIDSRVIMGKQGAEKLLGRGDMYFVDPSLNVPVRIQGPMLMDQEIDAVVKLWKKLAPRPAEENEAPWEELIDEAEKEISDKDEKDLKAAIKLVCRTRKASASNLQGKLNISFPKASRLLDRMEKIGVVGPIQVGGRSREVLWGEDEGDSYGENVGYQEE
jgi:S-DNA-T family DNA segregation ATPase FtsK/SpoIIIE